MAPAGFVVLVVVGSNDPGLTSALVDALGAALAPEATVVQSAQVDAPVEADRAAEKSRTAVDASGKVLVDWSVAPGRIARIRVQRAGTEHWIERDVEFAPRDPPRERGRLVGLIAGTIWRAMVFADRDPPAAAALPGPRPEASAALTAVPAPSAGAAIEPGGPGNRAVDAAAVFTTGLGGSAGRWGASVAGRWRPAGRRLGWRAGLDARAGELPAALATVYTLVVGLGASLTLVEPRPYRRFGLDLRGDVLAVGEIVSHLSSDDRAAVRHARWLPGADGGVDLTWSVSPALAVLLGGSVELAAGPTDVVVREERTATIPAWRLAARIGLRTRF
jgi:hypothetical protein